MCVYDHVTFVFVRRGGRERKEGNMCVKEEERSPLLLLCYTAEHKQEKKRVGFFFHSWQLRHTAQPWQSFLKYAKLMHLALRHLYLHHQSLNCLMSEKIDQVGYERFIKLALPNSPGNTLQTASQNSVL